jgi:hypothetical protein
MTTIIRWPVRRAMPPQDGCDSCSTDARVEELCRALEAEDAASGFGGLGPALPTPPAARLGPLRPGGSAGPAPRHPPSAEQLAYVQGARDGRVAAFCWGLMVGGIIVAAAILGGGVR